ncbi:MAG: hypothetical protein JNM25_08560 [Planctomycetes bacterium]|nr:hypothetical protein [Planctomycetota bacterium]
MLPRGHRDAEFLGRAFGWLLLGYVAFLLAVAAVQPDRWLLRDFAALPPWPVLLGALLFAVVAVATRRWRARGLAHALLALAMLPAWLTVCIQPLGDSELWRVWSARDQVGLSEMGANLVFRLTHRWFGPAAIDFVTPVFGVGFALAFLHLGECTLVAARPRRAAELRLWLAAALLLSGWQLFWFRSNVENSFLSLPFCLLALRHFAAHADGGGDAALRRAAAWLGAATFVHGYHLAMWPALLLTAACRYPPWRSPRQCLRGAVSALVVAAAVVAALAAACHVAGCAIVEGHITGGTDDRWLVPLDPKAAAAHYDFGLLWPEHGAALGNLVLLACPAAAPLLLLLLGPWRRGRRDRAALGAALRQRPDAAITALGGIGFASLYYFDLGFPADYDLMVSICTPTAVGLLLLLTSLPRATRRRGAILFGLAALPAGAILGSLLLPLAPPHPLGAAARGTADGALSANGSTTALRLRPGESLIFVLQPPVGAALPVQATVYGYRGVPAVAPAGGNGDRGFAFPDPSSPRWDPQRLVIISDGSPASLVPGPVLRLDGRLALPPFSPPPGFGTTTVQAELKDASGRRFVSNAVVVEPPRR